MLVIVLDGFSPIFSWMAISLLVRPCATWFKICRAPEIGEFEWLGTAPRLPPESRKRPARRGDTQESPRATERMAAISSKPLVPLSRYPQHLRPASRDVPSLSDNRQHHGLDDGTSVRWRAPPDTATRHTTSRSTMFGTGFGDPNFYHRPSSSTNPRKLAPCRVCATPSRNNGWSSTTTTRIRSASLYPTRSTLLTG